MTWTAKGARCLGNGDRGSRRGGVGDDCGCDRDVNLNVVDNDGPRPFNRGHTFINPNDMPTD
jgi:hypothetical protein